MNINIEFLNDMKSMVLFFDKSEVVKFESFVNLSLTIDALAAGHFSYSLPPDNAEDLISFIKSTEKKVKTIFVKLDRDGIQFGFLKTS